MVFSIFFVDMSWDICPWIPGLITVIFGKESMVRISHLANNSNSNNNSECVLANCKGKSNWYLKR